MTNRKIQVAALCALLSICKVYAQTGIVDPKIRAQWEKQQQRSLQNHSSPVASGSSTNSSKSTKTETALQLAERLGLLRTINGHFAIKWHNSDLILALPQNTNSSNPNAEGKTLGLIRDKKTRKDYAQYSFILPNGKAIAAIRTEIIAADTINGAPEFWLFRALNLTEQEYKMGSEALETIGASPINWPSAVTTVLAKSSDKDRKQVEYARKIQESVDSTLQRNDYWYLTNPTAGTTLNPTLHVTYADRGLCLVNSYASSATGAQLSRTAPLAAQLYRTILPYIKRLEANPTTIERTLLLKDLQQIGSSFFEHYNSNADAAYLANILLLIESNNPSSWLTNNPAYATYRGQSKSTYSFAQSIVTKSIFTDRNRYSRWLTQPNDTLLKQAQTDPVALWHTRPMEEFQTFSFSAPTFLENKNITRLFYVPQDPKHHSLERTTNTNLTELLNGRAKDYRKEDKKEKLPFSKRFTAIPNEEQTPPKGTRAK